MNKTQNSHRQNRGHPYWVGILGVLMGFPFSTYGLVKADIDDTIKLKVIFSHRDTNRITIDNSRVSQVFGIDELMAIQFDEENGQCFVKAKSNPGHPVTLTLITEDGETQDLEVTFADTASEVVVLHSIKKDLQPLSEVMGEGIESLQPQAVEVLKQLVRGQIPKGLSVMSLSEKQGTKLTNGVSIQYEKRLIGGGFEVMLGSLSSTECVTIKESQLAGEHDLAVYISQPEIKPGETVSCMVVRQRGAQ